MITLLVILVVIEAFLIARLIAFAGTQSQLARRHKESWTRATEQLNQALDHQHELTELTEGPGWRVTGPQETSNGMLVFYAQKDDHLRVVASVVVLDTFILFLPRRLRRAKLKAEATVKVLNRE